MRAIIQARMNSTRLPGKVLEGIGKQPMLHYVIRQTLASKSVSGVVVATTREKADDVIVQYCRHNRIEFFRGSGDDLLDRYFQCAKEFSCDPVIRITSDCPLIDPNVIDAVIDKFKRNSYDYVGNNIEKINGKWDNSSCNYPQGMTVEISTFNALRTAHENAKKPSEREHVFPYIQFNSKLFNISGLAMERDLSHIRCTVDHPDDLKFVRMIFKRLGYEKMLTISDIEMAIKEEPGLLEINGHIRFDEGYQRSLATDKRRGF